MNRKINRPCSEGTLDQMVYNHDEKD